jgi:methyl coenzyme M reductase gamma subunit
MFKSLPEGKSLKHHMSGTKYICRLVNFPYHDVSEIDLETRERLSRYRGVDVGTLSGLGKLKHQVRLGEELADLGLQLSAASYLLYSTG